MIKGYYIRGILNFLYVSKKLQEPNRKMAYEDK